jgi:membrane protein DedA with SNARE-associated domain
MWELINESPGWMTGAIDFVAGNPEAALAIAFLGAIIESLAIIGMFVPGTFILMGIAGAAAAAGHPMLPHFLIVAVLGAVMGDYLSFWVGHRYRHSIRRWWPLAQRPRLLESADRFFARYGSYSVALCRFIPVLRSTVPLIAGITGMKRRRFLIANVTSALVWAPAHIFPAQLAGLTIDRLRDGDYLSAAVLAAGVVACCAAAWILHRYLAPLVSPTRR